MRLVARQFRVQDFQLPETVSHLRIIRRQRGGGDGGIETPEQLLVGVGIAFVMAAGIIGKGARFWVSSDGSFSKS